MQVGTSKIFLRIFILVLFSLPVQMAGAQTLSTVRSKGDTTAITSGKLTPEEVNKRKLEAIQKQKEEEEKERKREGIDNKKEKAAAGVRDLPANTPSFITDSLDSYIERGMALWQIPGLAISIVKDGKVIFSKGYGTKEQNKTDKVDVNTLFIIASNTKLFTGTSLALLDYEKKLSLNDKVTKYIPWFRLYDSNSTRLVTVKDLLCHRLGTKTFQGDFTFWDSNLPKDSIIWKMRYLKPSQEFRQDFGYCNSAFLVAGRVLEKVTGKTWESFVKETILTPLGMDNTYMNTAKVEMKPNVAQPHNNLYGPLTVIPFDNVDNLGPATSMVSNVTDLSKWLIMQLDSGRYQGKTVIPWAVLQKTRDVNIMTGSRKSLAYPMHFRGYGLGVYTTDYSGRQVYWHTGGAFGHVTNVCFVPEEKLGITILTNNDNQSFFEALRYQILDAYLGVAYTDRSKYQYSFFIQGKKDTDDKLALMKARVEKNETPPIKLEDYTGTYYHTVYGKITISKNGDKLICRFEHHPFLFGQMEYMGDNEFRMTYSHQGYGVQPAKFIVANGKATGVTIQVNDFVETDAYLFVKDPRVIGR
jgi:CubicO group peptidase (beta-lactamase class C family)